MEAITDYFASLGLNLSDTLIAIGAILLGTLLLVIAGHIKVLQCSLRIREAYRSN